ERRAGFCPNERLRSLLGCTVHSKSIESPVDTRNFAPEGAGVRWKKGGSRPPLPAGRRTVRVGIFPREYPPHVYGGAGVHVDYLSRELAKKIAVEVHCWGPQHSDNGNLCVRGAEPWAEITNGTEAKFKNALEALSLNLTQVKALTGIDVVH